MAASTDRPRDPKRLSRLAFPMFAVLVLALAWTFAGYGPSGALALGGLQPLDVTADGSVLIAGTIGRTRDRVVAPLRFLSLTTGRDVESPLAVPLDLIPAELEPTIQTASLSRDGEVLVVILRPKNSLQQFGFSPRVIGRTRRTVIIVDRAVQTSPDGRLLAWTSEREHPKTVVVWDLAHRAERYRLPECSHPAFSPDGKLLATLEEKGERPHGTHVHLQIRDAATGVAARSVELAGDFGWDRRPRFSPDGRFVAVGIETEGKELIQVFDARTCESVAQVPDCGSPAFLSNGRRLIGVGPSSRFLPGFSDESLKNYTDRMQRNIMVPQVVLGDTASRTELRAYPYDQGEFMGTPVPPEPQPLGRDGQFSVLYHTASIGPGAPEGRAAVAALGRRLRVNIPRGWGLDAVDAMTGGTRTYHLDGALFPLPEQFPHARIILIPEAGQRVSVWDVPPKRSYRIVAIVGVVLLALWGALTSVRLLGARDPPGAGAGRDARRGPSHPHPGLPRAGAARGGGGPAPARQGEATPALTPLGPAPI